MFLYLYLFITFMFISYDNCSKALGEGIKVLFNDPKPLYGDGVDSSLLLYNQPYLLP